MNEQQKAFCRARLMIELWQDALIDAADGAVESTEEDKLYLRAILDLPIDVRTKLCHSMWVTLRNDVFDAIKKEEG